jgi:hypothetical protein
LTASDLRPSGAGDRVVPTMDGVDPLLVKAVRDGTYVVDPHAVAGAIVRRGQQRAEAARLAGVLESGEGLDASGRRPEHDAGPRADVA